MPAKFTVTKDKAGTFRFIMTAPNGQVVATSQGYRTRASALNGIKSIRRNAVTAAVEDATVERPAAARTTVKATRSASGAISAERQAKAPAKAAVKTSAKAPAKTSVRTSAKAPAKTSVRTSAKAPVKTSATASSAKPSSAKPATARAATKPGTRSATRHDRNRPSVGATVPAQRRATAGRRASRPAGA